MRIFTIWLFSLLLSGQTISQPHHWTWKARQPMPQAISNNAVTAASVNGQSYVYSFAGIDTTKQWSGITLKSFRYDVSDNQWDTIPPLPDTMGKIAAGASTLKGKIYIIGGYHVFSDGHEVSSSRIHIFDPSTNTYLSDGTPLPRPIDDHVQGIWRDSLIYVITGWSNGSNVNDVQVYHPEVDSWSLATPVPNTDDYKVFGASGTIIKDTIFYIGGAQYQFNFPLGVIYRKGVIHNNNPDSISWSHRIDTFARIYRSGATSLQQQPLWIGGAPKSYNYDGIAYDGSGGVSPLAQILYSSTRHDSLVRDSGVIPAVMDLRGVGKIGDGTFVIAGGMKKNQAVSDQTYIIQDTSVTTSREPLSFSFDISVQPNPFHGSTSFYISSAGRLTPSTFYLYNKKGQRVRSFLINNYPFTLQQKNLSSGLYIYKIKCRRQEYTGKIIIK